MAFLTIDHFLVWNFSGAWQVWLAMASGVLPNNHKLVSIDQYDTLQVPVYPAAGAWLQQ